MFSFTGIKIGRIPHGRMHIYWFPKASIYFFTISKRTQRKNHMNYNDLITIFSSSTENRRKAIFSTLFIAGNKLQTLFDNHIPEVSLKQFMLLSVVRQSKEPLTFTRLGNLLGCSRQNIKKLADVLMKKGFITVQQSPHDTRAMCICLTEKGHNYFANDFAQYQDELKYLFEVYTDEETETLFFLLTKLYAGIENLEKRTL
jgi:MarR family transcriptional repressor of emrRAB